MWARHAKTLKPVSIRNFRMVAACGVLTTLLPISALDKAKDPLTNTILSFAGVWAGVIPVLGGGYIAVPICIYVLRRISRQLQRPMSFVAGIFIGLIPFFFYYILELLGMASAPLRSLAVRGLISGSILGLLAAWYIPRSTWRRVGDSWS
ncbi:MAG: hypothetical protein QM808_09175 [Steroidobacteraceae bacterium]